MPAALLPGGAVVFDSSGRVSFGLSDESLDALVGEAPDYLRLAVAHFAAARAVETGLIEPEAGADEADVRDHRPVPSSPRGAMPEPEHGLEVIRSRAFLGAPLMSGCLRARRDGKAALPLVAWGGRSWVGPLLEPDGSPCILCVRRAVSPNRRCEPLLASVEEPEQAPTLTDGEIASLVREVARDPAREILEVDARGNVLARHPVRSNPECRVCGGARRDRNSACPVLQSCEARSSTDTGSRMSAPEETFAAYQHLISPLSGAVRRIRPVDVNGSALVHVFTASHAVSERSRSFAAVMRDGRDHSGGKGSTPEQARTSALCEALERFSAVAVGGEVDALGSFFDLPEAVHPAGCLHFSDAQYADRDAWNRSASRFQHVPEPFDENAEVAWSRVWCLQTRAPAYLPTGMLYFDFDGPGTAYGSADSNGLAAGRTLEEAVLQAFLELVERDAIAIWWYNRLGLPRVDVGSFDDSYVTALFEHYRALGRRAWVLDLTSDLGIPVFAAVSALAGAERPEVIFGFGAHLDAAVALRRCVTEMNQMLATVSRPPEQRRMQLRGAFDDVLRWWEEARLDANPYLVPHPELESRRRGCFESAASSDLKEDIETCLTIASRHGLDVYLRDMTRPDLGISVAKVVAPGLRHFWRRLAPGRLYDAPVVMGRREAPLTEADMNPVSLFV